MAEQDSLDKQKEHPQEAHSTQHAEKSLENEVNNKESKSFIAKSLGFAGNLVSTAAVLGTTLSLAGTSAAVVAAAFAGGYIVDRFRNNNKDNKSSILDELKLGSLLGTMSHFVYRGFFDYFPNADIYGKLIKGAVLVLGYLPIYNFVHLGLRHLVENYNPFTFVKNLFTKGPGGLAEETYEKGIKPTYADITKKHMLYLGPFAAANINYTVPELQIPVVSGLVLAYRLLFGGVEKKYQSAKQKHSPHLAPALGGAH